jgi:hypothetical protein
LLSEGNRSLRLHWRATATESCKGRGSRCRRLWVGIRFIIGTRC